MKTNAKVAVIICGPGNRDGSEIRETIFTLLALCQQNAEAVFFAPDKKQKDLINHLTGETCEKETREILTEAARLARGKVQPLSELDPKNFDALILPGGAGMAKNLSDFNTKGTKGSVIPELLNALTVFFNQSKPIGAICIAPTLLALAFAGKGLQLTVGKQCEVSQQIEQLGHKHIECTPNECVVDHSHKIVTTPAYMINNALLHDIFTGIQKLVTEVLKMS